MIDTRRRPVVPPGHPAVAQEGSFNIDTPDNAGDVVFDGESLNGLFAIVESLQATVDMLMGVSRARNLAALRGPRGRFGFAANWHRAAPLRGGT